jgi:DNA polymerase I-like protein with 3'-5' exonuclease and polymerase domains
MLEVRSKLKTCLQTFLRPWYEIGKKNNGTMYTQFNSTRSSGFGRSEVGAKSGRITSARPNFLNVPKTVDVPDGIGKRSQDLYNFLPLMRNYIYPHPGNVFIARDWASQELRILAHYEYDVLYKAYLENPMLDVHEMARAMISAMIGIELTRKPVKTIGFGIIYGMGLALLAKKMNLPIDKAQEIYDAYLEIFPGIGPLIKELKALERNNDYLTTLGGRVYYTEPPALVQGRMRHFGYKQLNYLIQPSAADMTKESFIKCMEAGLDIRIVLYDEFIANANPKTWRDEMETMRGIMANTAAEVPMLSDGKAGKKSWGECKKYKDVR